MLVKQGERLQVFLNKAKVFESDKAIPAGFLFNQLSLGSRAARSTRTAGCSSAT